MTHRLTTVPLRHRDTATQKGGMKFFLRNALREGRDEDILQRSSLHVFELIGMH